jgi:hypothetical protein
VPGAPFIWYSRQGLRPVACMLLIAMAGRAGVQVSIGFEYDQSLMLLSV